MDGPREVTTDPSRSQEATDVIRKRFAHPSALSVESVVGDGSEHTTFEVTKGGDERRVVEQTRNELREALVEGTASVPSVL